ncbi:hypothetical protein ONZ45_g1853 [Pleurotus djamor]|nr:hypothetical protein ONZ45_g1853 [Pleurotus djamor]
MSDTSTPSKHHQLKYNLTWVQDTFPSRQAAEILLSPEREQGNLTSRDYELAANFLPGPHKYYPRGYGALATGVSVLYARTRRWSAPRLVFIGASAYTLGFAFGQAARLRLHLKFLSSLENFDGFATALDNITQKNGGVMPRGPTLVVSSPNNGQGGLDIRPDITGGEQTHGQDKWGDADNTVPQEPRPPVITTPRSTQTRWDAIRAANSQAAQQSSWEAIRQKHGKANINGTQKPAETHDDRPNADADDERRQEQARFDAMLDAERKLGQSRSDV